jgi:Phage terminase large subunit (GpA)
MKLIRELVGSDPVAARAEQYTFGEFLQREVTTDNGPWTMHGHEPLLKLVELFQSVITTPIRDAEIIGLKAAQIGWSTLALALAFFLTSCRQLNVGYFLPTDKFAERFGQTRADKMIKAAPFLRAAMKERQVGGVHQKGLKEFRGHYFYLLGLESVANATSIPMDALIYDEVDLLDEENATWSEDRVAHSSLRLKLYLSVGMFPGAGIDARYQTGTQHRYAISCEHCGKRDQVLEDSFPDCMRVIDGAARRVCTRCHRELDLTRGRWIAEYPSREQDRRYSFKLSALSMSSIDGDYIWSRYTRALRRKAWLAKFNCSVLAKPDAGAMMPITDAEIELMKRAGVTLRLSGATTGAPRFAGVDVGDICHFWTHELLPAREGEPRQRQLVWIEEIDSDNLVERVATLIEKLDVRRLVIDKKPHTASARRLAYLFPRIVVLQDFAAGEMRVVDETHEGKRYKCLKVDRDDSLNQFCAEITDPDNPLLIPETDSEAMQMLARHLKQLRKNRTQDARGNEVDSFVRGVENHLGMAGNSGRLAEVISPKNVSFEVDFADAPQWSRAALGGLL